MPETLPRIDYYFDIVSPYSYIGFEILEKLKHQWKGVSIRYIPFSIADIMKESGNRPPGLLKPRSVMLLTDLQRTANFWNIPLTPPPKYMAWVKQYYNTRAMEILLVLEEQDKELMIRAAREFWLRLWSRSEKIFEHQDFVEVLKAVEVKNVEEAYGAPWINVITSDGEEYSFFGSDRFHLIADLLQQPLPDKLLFNQKSKL